MSNGVSVLVLLGPPVVAKRVIPIHDEHRPFGPLLKITSSVRDLDDVPRNGVEVLELALGERFAPPSGTPA